jgi:hypothetical protein
MTTETGTPESVVIDGLIFSRPFKRGATFNASIGVPIGSWLVEVTARTASPA